MPHESSQFQKNVFLYDKYEKDIEKGCFDIFQNIYFSLKNADSKTFTA